MCTSVPFFFASRTTSSYSLTTLKSYTPAACWPNHSFLMAFLASSFSIISFLATGLATAVLNILLMLIPPSFVAILSRWWSCWWIHGMQGNEWKFVFWLKGSWTLGPVSCKVAVATTFPWLKSYMCSLCQVAFGPRPLSTSDHSSHSMMKSSSAGTSVSDNEESVSWL